MSRKAGLLTADDVPQYIKSIVKRLRPVNLEFENKDGNWWGYTFRLDAKWKCGYNCQLVSDCEKLLTWSERWYAYAKLIRYAWWYDEVRTVSNDYVGSKYHRAKAIREGWRNHAYLVISDPVARRFELDGFYREPSK